MEAVGRFQIPQDAMLGDIEGMGARIARVYMERWENMAEDDRGSCLSAPRSHMRAATSCCAPSWPPSSPRRWPPPSAPRATAPRRRPWWSPDRRHDHDPLHLPARAGHVTPAAAFETAFANSLQQAGMRGPAPGAASRLAAATAVAASTGRRGRGPGRHCAPARYRAVMTAWLRRKADRDCLLALAAVTWVLGGEPAASAHARRRSTPAPQPAASSSWTVYHGTPPAPASRRRWRGRHHGRGLDLARSRRRDLRRAARVRGAGLRGDGERHRLRALRRHRRGGLVRASRQPGARRARFPAATSRPRWASPAPRSSTSPAARSSWWPTNW